MFMNHTPGKALDGHVIKTLQVKKQEQCELRCFHESECVSYNMGPSQVNGFTCELSNSDHVRHPDALVPRAGYIYRGTEVKKRPPLSWIRHIGKRDDPRDEVKKPVYNLIDWNQVYHVPF